MPIQRSIFRYFNDPTNMIAAIYARKSTDQSGVADEAKSVIQKIEHGSAHPLGKGETVAEDKLWFEPLIPPAPTRPRVGETLWEVRQDYHTWSARLLYHGEWGVEAQIFRDGEFVIGWRFTAKAEAVAWADEQRTGLAGR